MEKADIDTFLLASCDDKNRTLSSQVLEYYKRHSQNPELSKYFCGAVAACHIGDWHGQSAIIALNTTEADKDKPLEVVISELPQVPDSNVAEANIAATSPASSVTSNRKLEWDNGADIGYSNVETNKTLHKSISLPVLSSMQDVGFPKSLQLSSNNAEGITIQVPKQSTDGKNKSAPSSSTTESRSSSKKYFSSSSSLDYPPPKPYSFYSDSEASSNIAQTPDDLSKFLKRKVGHPVAESTPVVRTSSHNDFPVKFCDKADEIEAATVNFNMVDQVSFYKNVKMLKLSISKPTVVECEAVLHNIQSDRNKLVQTSLPRNASVGIQTDFDLLVGQIVQHEVKRDAERHSVFYVCHSDSDKGESTRNSAVQTNSSTILSQCSSFEYLQGADLDKEQKIMTSALEKNGISPKESSLTGTTSNSKTTTSSKESPLGDWISFNQRGKSMPELQKNLQLLQKVIKSKKYDDITKKHYVKKIMQRLVDFESSDDTNIVQSSLVLKAEDQAEATQHKKAVSARLSAQTFVNEILPSSVSPPVLQAENARLPRNALFTLSDSGRLLQSKPAESIGQGCGDSVNELYATLPPITPVTSSSKSKNTSKDFSSWRDDKTRSEKLLEQAASQNKDHLAHFAKKERNHQLHWINNEILHLNKLKGLLEQKSVSSSENSTKNDKSCKSLQKMHVEDMKGLKKATTVYVLTTESTSQSSKCCNCAPETCPNPNCVWRRDQKQQQNGRLEQVQNFTPRQPSLIGRGETVFDFGSEKIDLRCARLVSSEQFTADNGQERRCTSVRRYTIEVPIESPENAPKIDNEVEVINSHSAKYSSPRGSPKQIIKIREANCQPSCSGTSSPKAVNKLTHELVVTDEIVNRTVIEHTQPLYTETKKTQTVEQSESTSSTTISSSSSGTKTDQLCHCCKKQNVTPSGKYMLCYVCYNQNVAQPFYTYPGHICTCYNAAQSNIVKQIQDTVQKLSDLEKKPKYCKCPYNTIPSSTGYCSRCNCKLPKKYSGKKGGIAYLLTLETDSENKPKKRKKKKREPILEEIKIKLPSPRTQQNIRITVPGSPKKCYTKPKPCCCSSASEDSCKENYHRCHRRAKQPKKDARSDKPSLQDYLCANKPGFVASAEQRRKCLLDLAYMREQRCQKYKQLLALTNGIPLKAKIETDENKSEKKHVFTTKEMKALTAKHYKKLPEVQQKLVSNKEQQIKKANKLLADIFNQRLRQQVLKGRHTIPTDASIIKLA